jgi:hypothetical protein
VAVWDRMKSEKRKKLEKAGWRIGSAADFLALTPTEERYVETKLDFTPPKLTPAQQAELDRRLKAHAKNPANVVPSETVKADLAKKYDKP